MFRGISVLAGAAMTLVLLACGTSDKTGFGPMSTTQNQGASAGDSQAGTDCPRQIMADVTLTLTDVPNGIAVDFTTPRTEKVELLRTMVRHMADMLSSGGSSNGGDGMGGGHGGHHGGGSVSPKGMGSDGMMGGHHDMGSGCNMGGMAGGNCNGGMGGGMMNGGGMMSAFRGATIEAVDIEDGARLTFTTGDPQQVDALRTAVRDHFEAMPNGQCPMASM